MKTIIYLYKIYKYSTESHLEIYCQPLSPHKQRHFPHKDNKGILMSLVSCVKDSVIPKSYPPNL